MKQCFLIFVFFSSLSLVGCATIQAYDTNKKETTQKTKKVENRGTYFGGGVGVGVMSF